jgi:hypothetical protein
MKSEAVSARDRFNEAKKQKREQWHRHKDGDGNQEPQQKKRRFELKPFDTIKVSKIPNYLVKGILPRTGLAVVWGPPKCGKSFWVFDLVMHVAIGRKYRGCRVQQGRVVYLALEGGSGFAARIDAWRQRCRGEHDVPFFLIDTPLALVSDHRELIAAIREQLDGPPAVIIIDTLNRSLNGSENKDEDMSAYIRAADAIRAAFNCLVIIIHHCGVVGNRPRGHTSLSGADDVQIALERDKEGIIIAKVEHMKDAEAGAVMASQLERVDLGTDADGDPLSSCVIVPAEVAAAGVKLSKVNRFAFELLAKIIKTEGISAPAEAALPNDYRVCRMETWRERFYGISSGEDQHQKESLSPGHHRSRSHGRAACRFLARIRLAAEQAGQLMARLCTPLSRYLPAKPGRSGPSFPSPKYRVERQAGQAGQFDFPRFVPLRAPPRFSDGSLRDSGSVLPVGGGTNGTLS